jgi:hypothetical protein
MKTKKEYQKEILLGLRAERKRKISLSYSKSDEKEKIDRELESFISRGGEIDKDRKHGKYYIYILKDKDEPFYVGKGSGGRVLSHVDMVKQGLTPNWNYKLKNKILSILSSGRQVEWEIIFRTDFEEFAYSKEKMFIDVYLRRGFDLCNKSKGGDGPRGLCKKYLEIK